MRRLFTDIMNRSVDNIVGVLLELARLANLWFIKRLRCSFCYLKKLELRELPKQVRASCAV